VGGAYSQTDNGRSVADGMNKNRLIKYMNPLSHNISHNISTGDPQILTGYVLGPPAVNTGQKIRLSTPVSPIARAAAHGRGERV
jgi:hypothetical protein